MRRMLGILAILLAVFQAAGEEPEEARYKIDDYQSLGQYLYSVADFGIMKHSDMLLGVGVRDESVLPEGMAIFCSPDFDWKERQDELIIHVLHFSDLESAARYQDELKDNPRAVTPLRRGRFVLSGADKHSKPYFEAFADLEVAEDGNLLAPPLPKEYVSVDLSRGGVITVTFWFDKETFVEMLSEWYPPETIETILLDPTAFFAQEEAKEAEEKKAQTPPQPQTPVDDETRLGN